MKQLNFKVGKFYVDGHGKKWECLKTDLNNEYSIVLTDGNEIEQFTKEGFDFRNDNSPNNIVGEWVEKPIVDWSIMPAWAKFVAMDANGKWFWYIERPLTIISDWVNESGPYGIIPSEYAPKFDGDWTESLIERP